MTASRRDADVIRAALPAFSAIRDHAEALAKNQTQPPSYALGVAPECLLAIFAEADRLAERLHAIEKVCDEALDRVHALERSLGDLESWLRGLRRRGVMP